MKNPIEFEMCVKKFIEIEEAEFLKETKNKIFWVMADKRKKYFKRVIEKDEGFTTLDNERYEVEDGFHPKEFVYTELAVKRFIKKENEIGVTCPPKNKDFIDGVGFAIEEIKKQRRELAGSKLIEDDYDAEAHAGKYP